jgi:hypothetical protein
METTQYNMKKICFIKGTLFSASADTQKCGKKSLKLGEHNSTVCVGGRTSTKQWQALTRSQQRIKTDISFLLRKAMVHIVYLYGAPF